MSASPNPTIGNYSETIDRICRNLQVDKQAVLADPDFRKETGADELDRIEMLIQLEQEDR